MQAQNQLEAFSDAELITAMNGGDASAFEILYFRHRDWVAGLACRFTGDSDAALDVLQETFLYFLRKFPGFRLTCNLRTFLYPAVKNLSISAKLKAARCQAGPGEPDVIEQIPAPESAAQGIGDLAVVLARLPEEQRETLLLRFSDGFSLAEIAQAMEVPVGTVKSRMHNALETLRRDPRTLEFWHE